VFRAPSRQESDYDFRPEPFRSCLASALPFFDSAEASACGYKLRIALPKLMVPVVAGHVVHVGTAVPVIA